MGKLSQWLRQVRLLFSRTQFRDELDEEMTFHRSQVERELTNHGMKPEDARYAAIRRFGNTTNLRERSHQTVAFSFESILQDLRFSLRQLRKNPAFAVTSISILALGIAASVAIFAFVDAALLKPLPYKDPNRLAVLFESIPLGPRFHLSYPDYLDWKHDNQVFSSLEVYAPYGFMMRTSEGLRQTDGAHVSAGFFRTLGVKPILGRDFYEGEDRPEAARATILSYAAWQKRYGGNPSIIGQTVVFDGDPYTIIGVLPREFSFAPAEPADFWAIQKPGSCRGCHGLFGIARLKPGVSFATGFADIKTVADKLARQYPDSNRDQAAYMLPLVEVVVGDIRPILLVVLSGAGLLLLIAGINVASLLLVRAENRRREMAVRGALGASPRRLATQFVTEGLLLAAVGCLLGIVLAQQGMHILTPLIPKDMREAMPFLVGLGLNVRVVAFACALGLLSGLLFALTPLGRSRFTQIREGLTQGGRASASTVWRRFGTNLVVTELATAMVLLAGAGLLGKSLFRLLHTDIGIEPDNTALIHVQAQPDKYDKPAQRAELVREIIHRVSVLPGVTAAGVTTKLPIEDADYTTGFSYIGRPENGVHKEVAIRMVTAGYMATLKTRLVSGRYFAEDDDPSKPSVVLINQAMAKQYFAGENPVGQQIGFEPHDKHPMQIVGVMSDVQEGQLDAGPRAAMYLPFYQRPDNAFVVLVRSAHEDRSLLASLSSTLRSVDPGMALYQPMTMNQKIHDAPSTYLHRSSAWLVGGFAAMALLLGVVGLYGVIAYSVNQRTREIGVRMALGAQRTMIYRMILFEAGRLIGIGVVLGLVCSVVAATLMRKLLFGVQAWDAATLIGVGLLLAGSSLLASFLPARRAASMNPNDALRAE
ncbi:MAG TPA: ABC transporter permease [Terracidiphilus sp.]|nr:ABC transporter permease [Terracidiphilus sp.]